MQQAQQNGNTVVMSPSTTGYDPIKVLNSATGRQVLKNKQIFVLHVIVRVNRNRILN